MQRKILLTLYFFCKIIIVNAQAWVELGTDTISVFNTVAIDPIAVDTSGYVYATGVSFNGASEYRNIVMWNGNSWKELGSRDSLPILSKSVYVDHFGNVYSCGSFIDSTGILKSYVAKWNGKAWELIGGGYTHFSNTGIGMCVDDSGNVYVVGSLVNLNNGAYIGTWNVIKWNGTTWTELGALNATDGIGTLCVDDSGNIYGSVSSYGVSYVAKWNGNTWTELGALTTTNSIGPICVDDYGNVYAALDSHGVSYVAKWNGKSWIELGTGSNALNANNEIRSICINDSNNIFVAGVFYNKNGNQYVAKWNGIRWTELRTANSALNANSAINFVTVDKAGNVFVAGGFTDIMNHYYVAEFLQTGVPATITPVSSTSFCPGDSVILNTDTGSSYTYQWGNNWTIIPGATSSSYIAKTSGSYTVSITYGKYTTTSNPTKVTVNPLPKSGSNQYITTDSTILQGNNLFPFFGTWSVVSGTGFFADSSNPTTLVIGLSQGANIFAWTINNDSCTPSGDTVTITVEGTTGVISGSSTDSYIVRPNPFNDHTTIRINAGEKEQINFCITNLNGMILYSTSQYYTNEDIVIGNNLPSGVYFAQLSYGSEVKVIKLVKI